MAGFVEVVEIIHDRHGVPLSEQGPDDMGTDETGPSRNEDLHGKESIRQDSQG